VLVEKCVSTGDYSNPRLKAHSFLPPRVQSIKTNALSGSSPHLASSRTHHMLQHVMLPRERLATPIGTIKLDRLIISVFAVALEVLIEVSEI
jgi:hypothetical protein